MSLHSSKGIKELSPEDKLKIANLIKELARYFLVFDPSFVNKLVPFSIGHEKEIVEGKLEQERKLFETQMKTLLTDYDKLMKDNQSKYSTNLLINNYFSPHSELLSRYNETKTLLHEYEKKSQGSTRPSSSQDFPNPQRVRSILLENIPLDFPTLVFNTYSCSFERTEYCSFETRNGVCSSFSYSEYDSY